MKSQKLDPYYGDFTHAIHQEILFKDHPHQTRWQPSTKVPHIKIKDLFFQIKEHLLAQKHKAQEKGDIDDLIEVCVYRSRTGKKCAVGCLITEENYHPDIEFNSVESRHVQNAIIQSFADSDERKNCKDERLRDQTVKFLMDFQDLHDAVDPEKWADAIDELENRWTPMFQHRI